MEMKNGEDDVQHKQISANASDSSGSDDSSKAGKGAEEGPEIIAEPEFLKNLPPDARKVVEIGMSMHRIGPMSMPSPLTEKINDKHIDKILDIAAKDDERSFVDAASSRKFTLTYVLVGVAVFVFLTVYLVGENTELYKDVMKLFAAFLGGFGGGFGVKSYIDRDK